jgi:hypothetical protein
LDRELSQATTTLKLEDDQSSSSPNDLTRADGYSTSPQMESVANSQSVPNFIITRNGYGSISFKVPVDLTGISSIGDLQNFVEIDEGKAAIYPTKHSGSGAGQGMNVLAEISLENVKPTDDKPLDVFTDELKSRPNTRFISYDKDKSVWTFEVQDFSADGFAI